MPDIPRRLPPTPAERLNVVVSRMAGGSAAGATRWAQPVASSTYRPADAPAEPAGPAGATILTAALGERAQVSVEYDDDDVLVQVFRDVLALPGLQANCVYLIEAEVVASFDYSTSDSGGTQGVRLMWGGPDRTAGTTNVSYTSLSFSLLTNRRDAYTQPADVYTVSSYNSPDDSGILGTLVRITWVIGVDDNGGDPPPPLRLRAACTGQSDQMIDSGAFIRATYLGPVIYPS